MKLLGLLILSLGIALLIFVLINYYKEAARLRSPLPKEGGVKVIFFTPTPSR